MSNGEPIRDQGADSNESQPTSPPSSTTASSNDLSLSEDGALALLKQADLAPEVIEQIVRSGSVLKYRKVKLALVEHPRTPRHLSVPLVRQLFTFDLMHVALTPTVPADLKRMADEALCTRLETISSGERLSLARRSSGHVAGSLLRDSEARVVHVALENPRLTESLVIKAVVNPKTPSHSVIAVCHHPQWSARREVRIALLRSEKTPMAKAIEFARGLPPALLREILHNSRLPHPIKSYLLHELGGAAHAREAQPRSSIRTFK